jgi:hypothetical protein
MAWSCCRTRKRPSSRQNWERILTISPRRRTRRWSRQVRHQRRSGRQHRRRGLLPASQVDVITPKNLTSPTWATPTISRSSSSIHEPQNIVLSRRELIEAGAHRTPPEIAGRHGAGRRPQGHGQESSPTSAPSWISTVIDGLLHITDMSWGRVGHPSEVCSRSVKNSTWSCSMSTAKRNVFQLGLKQKMRQPVGRASIASSPSAPRSKARSSTSCPTAPSSNWNPASKASSTSPSCPGPSASPNRASDVLKQDQEVEADGARHQPRRAEDLARPAAAREQSVGQCRGPTYPVGTKRQGQDPQPHQLRRLRRTGRRPGRHDPRFRHLLDAQDQSPFRRC